MSIDISLRTDRRASSDLRRQLSRFATIDGNWLHVLMADKIPWFVVFDILESEGLKLIPGSTTISVSGRDASPDCVGWVVTHVGYLQPRNDPVDFATTFPGALGGYVDWDTDLIVDESEILGDYGIISVGEAYVVRRPIVEMLGELETRRVLTVDGQESSYVRARPIASAAVLDPSSVVSLPNATPPRVQERTFYLAREGVDVPEALRADALRIGYGGLRHPWTVGLRLGQNLSRAFGDQVGLLAILGSESKTASLIRAILQRAARLGG